MNKEAKLYLYQAALLVVVGAYLAMLEPFETAFSFDTPTGRGLMGWATMAMMLVSLGYTLRKREFLQAPGRLIYWKAAHITTGFLFAALLIFHANGQPGIGLSVFLNSLAALITLTGLWGVIKQGYIPEVMTDTLIDPVYKSEQQDSVNRLIVEIDERLVNATEEFNEIYQRHVLPFTVIALPSEEQQKMMLQRCFGPDDINPNAAISDVKRLSGEEKTLFFEVAEKAMDIVEIRRGQSYQRQMNRWLIWHVGFSVFILLCLFFHILSNHFF